MTSSYASPGSHCYEGGVNQTDIRCFQRSVEHRAKLIKFFRLRLETHAHAVAVREYSEDRRYLRDQIKRLEHERDQVSAHLRARPTDQMFSRLGHLDADLEELRIEIELIDEAIQARRALVDPTRRLIASLRDLLRKARIDIYVCRPGRSESVSVTSLPIYSDARAMD
jgi:chromosome segregation ATPase